MEGVSRRPGRRAALSLTIFVAAAISLTPVRAGAPPPTDTAPCTRAQTRTALNSFVTAFNQGDFARLDSLFADEPAFQWFSSQHPGRRLGAEAKRRDTLIPYLRRRHARDEEFRLRAFNFSGNSARWSNFWFEALRSADGFGDGDWRRVVGKGAAICDQGSPQLIVLSLGRPEPAGS